VKNRFQSLLLLSATCAATARTPSRCTLVGRRRKLNSVDLTHSLKATGFKPSPLNISILISKRAFHMGQPAPLRLVRLSDGKVVDRKVGLYKLNPADPSRLKPARFQLLSLQSENPLSKFAASNSSTLYRLQQGVPQRLHPFAARRGSAR
jgi:hypothetical protein